VAPDTSSPSVFIACRFLLPVTIGEAPIPPIITQLLDPATPFDIATAMPFQSLLFLTRNCYILRDVPTALPFWVTKHVTNSLTYRVTPLGYAQC